MPPAVENAVPPTNISIINRIFAWNDIEDIFMNWKPELVEALTM
jgi:hypothetical protein